MIRAAVLLLGVALLGDCRAPVTPPPDASDAAPAPSPCQAACTTMRAAGCVVQPDCVEVIAQVTAARLIRNPKTGMPLTCADVAAARTARDIQALGQPCGPVSSNDGGDGGP